MDTTINGSVSPINAYRNPSADAKRSSDKVAGTAEDGRRPPKAEQINTDTGSEKGDRVELTAIRMVSESNQAAAKTELEDIDAVAQKIHEVKQWLESEYESAQAQQIHQLDAFNLVEVLS